MEAESPFRMLLVYKKSKTKENLALCGALVKSVGTSSSYGVRLENYCILPNGGYICVIWSAAGLF